MSATLVPPISGQACIEKPSSGGYATDAFYAGSEGPLGGRHRLNSSAVERFLRFLSALSIRGYKPGHAGPRATLLPPGLPLRSQPFRPVRLDWLGLQPRLNAVYASVLRLRHRPGSAGAAGWMRAAICLMTTTTDHASLPTTVTSPLLFVRTPRSLQTGVRRHWLRLVFALSRAHCRPHRPPLVI